MKIFITPTISENWRKIIKINARILQHYPEFLLPCSVFRESRWKAGAPAGSRGGKRGDKITIKATIKDIKNMC